MILVTGSTGFVGLALVKALQFEGHKVREVTRNKELVTADRFYMPSINGDSDWQNILDGVDIVVHCAAHVHQMEQNEENDLLFESVNVNGTEKLALECVKSGVSKLVFLSTIKVCGETTKQGEVITPDTLPNPQDAYSKSKYKAEIKLREISNSSSLRYVIVRPPLIYGKGAKGNLSSLKKLILATIPLPFSLVRNKRSIVGLDNLVQFILFAISSPQTTNRVFNISDPKALSLADQIKILKSEAGSKSLLFPVPIIVLKGIFKLIGKADVFEKLTSSLEIDSIACTQGLDWKAKKTSHESVASLLK